MDRITAATILTSTDSRITTKNPHLSAEKGIPEPEGKKEEADNTEESDKAAKLEEETEAELKAEERTPEDFFKQESDRDENKNGSRGIFSGATK